MVILSGIQYVQVIMFYCCVYICVAFKDSTTILSVPIQVLDLHGACHGLFYVQ